MKIFTLGYQNLSAELYVRSLINAGVSLVLDVREHAWSQRPAFIKSNLERSLSAVGIEYSHIKRAGNPSRNRKTARNASECMKRYRNYLRDNRDCLHEVIDAINKAEQAGGVVCMTCYERQPEDCHRSVLLEELLKLVPHLQPIHLQPTMESKKKSENGRTKPSLNATAFLAPQFLPFR